MEDDVTVSHRQRRNRRPIESSLETIVSLSETSPRDAAFRSFSATKLARLRRAPGESFFVGSIARFAFARRRSIFGGLADSRGDIFPKNFREITRGSKQNRSIIKSERILSIGDFARRHLLIRENFFVISFQNRRTHRLRASEQSIATR